MSLGNSAKFIAGYNTLYNAKVGSGFVGLLDLYPSADIAYSVRKLSSAYTGYALRVRRDSDNTELDIGFTNSGNLDETALSNFVGANNGYVTLLYDQSGNNNNANQTTALYQPNLVKNGNIIKVNNKVAIDYNDAGLKFLNINSTVIANTNMFIYHVGERTVLSKTYTPFGSGNTLFGFFSNNVLYFYGKEAWANGINNTIGQQLLIGTAHPNDYKVYQNNSNKPMFLSVANYNGTYSSVCNYGSTGQNGKIQEQVIWNFNRIPDRSGITDNINTYYGIF